GGKGLTSLGPGQALIVGMAQALALLPGISRSGSTITAGLFSRLNREAAGTFSFLLAVPAVAGATLLELKDVLGGGSELPWTSALAGVGTAAVAGYFSLLLLLRFVRAGKLRYFAYYTWVVGALV